MLKVTDIEGLSDEIVKAFDRVSLARHGDNARKSTSCRGKKGADLSLCLFNAR